MIDLKLLAIGGRYSRTQLAVAWGYRGWQAIARGVITPRASKLILLFVTRVKQKSLRQYQDHIEGDFLYWEGEGEHVTDARIAAAESRGDEIHVFFREIHHALFEYKGLASVFSVISHEDRPSEFVFQLRNPQDAEDELARHGAELLSLTATERESVVKARIGQGVFRKNVAELWGTCSVSGTGLQEILRASHIKPWRVSSNEERLDAYNGLLLLPNYDVLFDLGLISFGENGEIMISRALAPRDRERLGIGKSDRLRCVFPMQREYLRYHREKVFADVSAQGEE